MNEESYNLSGFKIGFIFVMFILAFFAAYAPLKISFIRNSKTALSLIHSFGAGIFISIALIHLLPEVG